MQSPERIELVPLDLSRFFVVHPTIETERLRLRQRTMQDAYDIFEYASNPIVTKSMIWDSHRSIQDTIDFLERSTFPSKDRSSIGFAIDLKSEGKMIGDCAFHHISSYHHSAQIGYVQNPKYWGKGYMNEAVRGLLRFAFREMNMHRIEAHCDLENERSARVLERCGMTLEATLKGNELRRGRFVTTKVYGILHNELTD